MCGICLKSYGQRLLGYGADGEFYVVVGVFVLDREADVVGE